jgi:hypothetical protein
LGNLSNARHGTCFIRLRQEREGEAAAGLWAWFWEGTASGRAIESKDEGSTARLEVVPSVFEQAVF